MSSVFKGMYTLKNTTRKTDYFGNLEKSILKHKEKETSQLWEIWRLGHVSKNAHRVLPIAI